MPYCRVRCFCIVLCLLSLIWLDANKMCFRQPSAVQGPQQCLSHRPLQIRVSLAWSIGEAIDIPSAEGHQSGFTQMKFCFPEGKPRPPAVMQTCPLFKPIWVGHIKLFSRWRLGPSLAVRPLLTVPLRFLLKPLERNKVASSFQTGFREASVWTEIKPKNLWKRRFSPILLSYSFISSYPHIFLPNEPKVFQEAFTLFYIHSHIKIMTFFSFTFSSLSQCKPGCEETLILEKSTGCFHKTQNNTLLLFWNKMVHVRAFAKIKRCELKQASLCLWK